MPVEASRQEPNVGHSDPTQYSSKTGRRVKFAVLFASLVLIIAFGVIHHQRSSDANDLARVTVEKLLTKIPVSAVRVGAGSATEALSLPGATAAWNETTIYARVNGYVEKWNANIGDTVKKGQTLARIATPELDSDLDAARAKLRADQAEVKVREAALEFARTTYERWKDSPKGVVSDQEREAKKADWESAVAQLNAAQSRVSLDRAGVDRLVTLTHFKEVTAPFDGTVTERHIDIGNLVTAGSTSNTTPLYKVAQNDPIRIFVEVPQSLADAVVIGTPVTVSVQQKGNQRLTGSVVRTAHAIDPIARTLRAEIDLPNGNGLLVAGLYVQVEFNLPSGSLIQVPAAALLFRSGGPQAAVISNDGTISFRNVQIARDQGNLIQLSSGLKLGEVVALNLSSQVSAGDKVDVRLQEDAAPKAAVAEHK